MTEENERQTRKMRIDPLLRAAGWIIIAYKDRMNLAQYNKYAIEEYPTDNGPADYALCVDGKIIAVVEAKKVTRSANGVLTQAERYAQGLSNNPYNFEGLHVPFLYSTNGTAIFFHDVRNHFNLSREITMFHTPHALLEKLNQNFERACFDLRETLIKRKKRLAKNGYRDFCNSSISFPICLTVLFLRYFFRSLV